MSSSTQDQFGFNTRRTSVKMTGLSLMALSFQTLGIIYSDIGTSPLYTMNGIWPPSGPVPSKEDVIGGVSAIIWALTLLPLLKYVFIALRFGTREGDGGTFALYQGLYPPNELNGDEDRILTGETLNNDANVKRADSNPSLSMRIKSKSQIVLLIWCIFGTGLTIADGIFTPAISVTSAVTGIGVAKPSIVHPKDITGISIGFLLVLFFAQQFGTHRLAFTFAPISFIWFLFLMGTGIYNITFFPGIFRAFDPSRAVLLFVRTKDYGLLSGVLLALTGCEAMFANLGQFNRPSIQLAFSLFVYPGVTLAYLGQGARLIHDGSVLENMFYNTIPGPANGALYWIVFVVAVLATLVASQAMISATFSLVQQLIAMKSFPPIRLIYTSETIQGQVYLPTVNWLLMIATIVMVAVFKNLVNLGNAYGFAVATVMFSTSILIGVQIFYVKRLPIIVSLAYILTFGFFDALFWGAALKKVPLGAWVPLVIGVVVALFMLLWTWGKTLEEKFENSNRRNLRQFIQQNERSHFISQTKTVGTVVESDEDLAYNTFSYFTSAAQRSDEKLSHDSSSELEEKRAIDRIPTCAVFHKLAAGTGVPHSFVGFIRQWPALPRVVVFLSVAIVAVPRVPPQNRYVVNKVRTVDGFYGATYYIGFRDDFDVKIKELMEKIYEAERLANPRADAVIAELKAASRTATHIAPYYNIVSKPVEGGFLAPVASYIRKWLIEDLYKRLAMMFPDTANWLTSADEIIRVGINAVI